MSHRNIPYTLLCFQTSTKTVVKIRNQIPPRTSFSSFFFHHITKKMSNSSRLLASRLHGTVFKMSNIRYGSSQVGDLGSGAGKGGGGGGSIREAGGSFGKREAAQEEEYFYRQQKEQLSKLKDSLHDEVSFHEEQIKRHQEAIARNKKRIEDLAAEKK